MRRGVLFLVLALLLLLVFTFIARQSRRSQTTAPLPPSLPIVEGTPGDPPQHSGAPFLARDPNPAAARQALGKALGSLSLIDWHFYASALEEMQDGAYPEYRRFAKEFLEAAGPEVVPIVESLLAECASREARFLLISVLGNARRPDAVPLLKKLIETEPDRRWTIKSALFSIGMSNSDEGFEFLTDFIRSGKAGTPEEAESHWDAAHAALGQQGARALDFLLEEARRRTADREYPNPSVIGGVRGKDAVPRLRSLARTDPDPMIRLGAAMALASTTDPSQLESLALLDPATAGRALLAARNRPDIWDDSAATRRKVAERLFAAAGPITGDDHRDSALLEAAMFLPPDRTRALMESLVAKPPRHKDREELIRFVAAFSDQPDVIQRAQDLGKAWGLTESECACLVFEGARAGALPGRQLHPSTIERLFDIVGNPSSEEWQRQQAMSSIMLGGVPGTTQSEVLSRIWSQPLTLSQRREILGAVTVGSNSSMPSRGAIRGTKPERFLNAVILRETQEPVLRAVAAYGIYSGGCPSTDRAVQSALDAFLRFSNGSSVPDPPGFQGLYTGHYLFHAMMAHFARHGTAADLPALSRKGVDFAGSWGEDASRLQERLKRAIDAIRMSGR